MKSRSKSLSVPLIAVISISLCVIVVAVSAESETAEEINRRKAQAEKQKIIENADLESSDMYKRLGISSFAREATIKRAYRVLTLKWHPDRNSGDPDAHEKFLKLKEAHEVLTTNRALYDLHYYSWGVVPPFYDENYGYGMDSEREKEADENDSDDEKEEKETWESDDDAPIEFTPGELFMLVVVISPFFFMCCCIGVRSTLKVVKWVVILLLGVAIFFIMIETSRQFYSDQNNGDQLEDTMAFTSAAVITFIIMVGIPWCFSLCCGGKKGKKKKRL